jgi:hypothetical protein
MKKLSSAGVASLLCASALWGATLSGSRASYANADTRNRFIGAWRLVWLEEEGADGKLHRADCIGMFAFTPEGRASVQVMYRSSRAGTPGGMVQYAQGSYEASFGRYEIDERAHTFTYHVEGALVPGLIGKDLIRMFELSGNQLIVTPSNPNELWRVAWEHY